MTQTIRIRALGMAVLLPMLGLSAPAQPQVPVDALICITSSMSDHLRTALTRLSSETMTEAERKAINARGGACRAKFGWSVAKTGEALSYAGFHLRTEAEREKLLARGVPHATITDIEGAALLFYTHSVQQRDPAVFDRWLKARGWQTLAAFRSSQYFPFFDAYAGGIIAREKYITTP